MKPVSKYNKHGEAGSYKTVYDYMSCGEASEGNADNSFLTMWSSQALMFGIINIIGNFGTVFVDQSYWQSSVAAKPQQGAWGFILGGIVWFSVPYAFSLTFGSAYISLTESGCMKALNQSMIGSGMVAPTVISVIYGRTGNILTVVLLLMAVMSTGSAEIMAVTSILIYDIYQPYLKPFRVTFDPATCVLCGKEKGRKANPRFRCLCISITYCKKCSDDDEYRSNQRSSQKQKFKCNMHGSYREYNEMLSGLKNWCMLWATIIIIPMSLLIAISPIDQNWLYSFMGILIGSAVIPITLCMFWSRLTGIAMISAAVSGQVSAIVIWITVAYMKRGLNDFLTDTGDDIAMLSGNIAAISVGGVVCVVVSCITNRNACAENSNEVWETTRDIDSPLVPWTERYARELKLEFANTLDNRPSLDVVIKCFKVAQYNAVLGSTLITTIVIIVVPCFSLISTVFDYPSFKAWIVLAQFWTFATALFIIIMPLINEGWNVFTILKRATQVNDIKIKENEARQSCTNELGDAMPRKKATSKARSLSQTIDEDQSKLPGENISSMM